MIYEYISNECLLVFNERSTNTTENFYPCLLLQMVIGVFLEM
jgi:hypothetical protein